MDDSILSKSSVFSGHDTNSSVVDPMSSGVLPRLIFGTAGFDLGTSWNTHIRLLNHAWDCGIHTYDTAPIYAHGQAEQILGEFLKRHRAIVHTKCGLSCQPLPRLPAPIFLALRVLKDIKSKFKLSVIPSSRSVASVSTSNCKTLPSHLSPKNLELSFLGSLKKLGVDSVHSLLLHEVSIEYANSPELTELFYSLKDRKLITNCGVAGNPVTIGAAMELKPPFSIYQTEGFLGNDSHFQSLNASTHGIAYSTLRPLKKILHYVETQQKLSRWQTELDSDLMGEESFACWLIATALNLVSVSQVIFFSKNPNHISDITIGVPKLQMDSERLMRFSRLCKEALSFDN